MNLMFDFLFSFLHIDRYNLIDDLNSPPFFSPCRSSLSDGGGEEPKPVRRASLVVGVVASLIIVLSVALVAFTPLLTTEIDKRAEEGE